MSAVAVDGPTDLAPLEPWLADRLQTDAVRIDDLRRHAEGFSWATYTFTAAWSADGSPRREGFAVRCEPRDGLMPPYDAAVQFDLQRALAAESTLPIPAARWLEPDPSVLGTPFYVMDRVEGYVPVPWRPDDRAAFPNEERRHRIGEQFVDELCTLHALDPARLGLPVNDTDPRAAAATEVAHWRRRYEDNATRSIPMLERAFTWLEQPVNIEVSGRLVPCHGDYRIGNFMLDARGRINALFDWELAHAGDPVEDLAWSALRLFRGRSPRWSHLLTEPEFLARYTRTTGTSVTEGALLFWTIVGYAKACASYVRGAATFERGRSDDLRLAAMGHQITFLLRLLGDALTGSR